MSRKLTVAIVALLISLMLLLLAVYYGKFSMFGYIVKYLPLVLDGLILTIEVTLFGIFGGLALGTLLAIGDMYGGKAISTAIRLYVEFFRGSPIIIQLFMFLYVIPTLFHILIEPITVGFAVFALNSAAYQKGYVKGAMEAVFEDQMTAGLSVGMSKPQIILYVILPQALRIVIPAWSNEFCSLTKSTAAVLVIGLRDLTAVGMTIVGQTWRILETYVFIAVLYFVWITAVTKIADVVYERKKIPGIEISV
ncbi:amino acid ABC transporter permease [Candidatus Bathyarchaeota archaeon]|jgi:polar amino acid transport system permease protein|nr:amino acid ABC transporter permease [Candidatus Bathyarchaeota archaeon]